MKIILFFIVVLPSLCLAKDVTFYNYSLTIPEQYTIFDDDPLTKGKVFVVDKEKKGVLVVEKIEKDKKRFFPLKEYGKSTHRELFYELYSDKPTNNEAVLEIRQMGAKYEFEITENNGFVFFRIDNPTDTLDATKFIISTPINDEVLDMSFTNRANEKFINSVINSLKVNNYLMP